MLSSREDKIMPEIPVTPPDSSFCKKTNPLTLTPFIMAGAFEHLKVIDLSKEEQDAIAECERRITTLKFKTSPRGYDLCDDIAGLEIVAKDFIRIFAPWSKV